MPATPSFLSPKELSRVLGVGESTVKRWADAGTIHMVVTPGGHRRIALSEAVDFIRGQRLPIVDPSPLGLDQTPPSPGNDAANPQWTHQVESALIAGDEPLVHNLLVGAYLNGTSVAALADHGLRPAFAVIGELWQHGPEGIAREHLAIQITVAALARIRALVAPSPEGPTAIGGAPQGDPYILPSMLAAMVLVENGWRALNLGPDVPVIAFQSAMLLHRPRLAWVSIAGNGDRTTELANLAAVGKHHQCKIIAGGRRCPPAQPQAGWQRVSSMTELAAIAHALRDMAVGTPMPLL